MRSEQDSVGTPAGGEAPAEIPKRWSAQRKTALVLWLLRRYPQSLTPCHFVLQSIV